MKASEKNQYTLIKLQESSLIEFKKRFDEIISNHIIVILSEDFNMNEKNISFSIVSVIAYFDEFMGTKPQRKSEQIPSARF